MKLKSPLIWVLLSGTIFAVGYTWHLIDQDCSTAIYLKFVGWLSLLTAVGFVIRPSHRLIGKIFFGFVVLMVIGICWKTMHWGLADKIIIVGLMGMCLSYISMLFVKSKSPD